LRRSGGSAYKRIVTAATALSIELADEAATALLAARLAGRARQGDVLALAGELGAGKTAFARAFIRARGSGTEEVPSPTFTLVEEYAFPGRPPVFHFDLYRLETPAEAVELGIEEAFADGITLIEWPERLGPLLPAERLELRLEPGARPEQRIATLTPSPGWADRLAGLTND
jgi:tRNA threonylcarbamoyladenosine biosynthesis protein TsaE